MSRKLRSHFSFLVPGLAVYAIVGLLGGCKKTEEAPKPPPPAPAPQAQAPFRVTRVDLGKAIGADKKVAAPSASFKPTDTIYASIVSEGAAPNVALGIRWTFEDGQLVNEAKQSIAPTGPAVTEFHIAKPDGFPAGKYKIEVSANGQPAAAAQFVVVD